MPVNNRSQDETLARITELAREAMAAQARFAKESIELGRASLSSEVDATAAGRAWVEAVSREGARYWREVGALGLDVAGSLVSIGSRSLARVISDTQSATHSRPSRASQPGRAMSGATSHGSARQQDAWRPSPREADGGGDDEQGDGVVLSGPATEEEQGRRVGDVRRAAVTLHGRPGDTATGTVTLANAHPRARRVLLAPGRLQPDTGRHVSLELRVDPEGVTIPAGAEHDVQLEVDLSPEIVTRGERYVGIIEVTGGVEAVLDVAVVVEE